TELVRCAVGNRCRFIHIGTPIGTIPEAPCGEVLEILGPYPGHQHLLLWPAHTVHIYITVWRWRTRHCGVYQYACPERTVVSAVGRVADEERRIHLPMVLKGRLAPRRNGDERVTHLFEGEHSGIGTPDPVAKDIRGIV